MPSAGAPVGAVAYLTNSTTTLPKATYVPLKVPQDENTRTELSNSGGAVKKSGFIRSLNLQPGEVDEVSITLTPNANRQAPSPLIALAKSFEGSPISSALPAASQFASVADADLIAFGNALVDIRQKALTAAQQLAPAVLAAAPVDADKVAGALNLANTAQVRTKAYSGATSSATSPIGMLNLERIEMTPAGIERGGLIATIPLAPKERTVVVQQEWSVITQDFASVVTDALDNYSETGVTDNTQLSQSTTSQVAHSNQFNINASVSGSYGFVTASVATAFGTQDQSSQSATNSRQHSVQTTQKASSRSIQSHKITISTSTTTGSSNANTRMLENPSATDPMRIDYFSIMRKWYCALYRYGLRLTYDITVPEPGAAMREIYEQIDILQKSVGGLFGFNINHSDISADIKPGQTEPYYLVLADEFSVDVPPPSPSDVIVQVGPVSISTPANATPVSFTVPTNYWVTSILATNYLGAAPHDPFLVVGGNNAQLTGLSLVGGGVDLCAGNQYLWHQGGSLSITLMYGSSSQHAGEVFFTVHCSPTDDAVAQWRSTVWSALYNAAQTQFYAQQQQINAQITALQNKIANVDTLTLRREENDEIMKCTLRWLLGNGFEFMPQSVVNLLKKASGSNQQYGVAFTGNDSGLTSNDWSIVKQNEDRINFINQAIDWDNVIYFVYSYFWDDPQSWDFIRQIQHPDFDS